MVNYSYICLFALQISHFLLIVLYFPQEVMVHLQDLFSLNYVDYIV